MCCSTARALPKYRSQVSHSWSGMSWPRAFICCCRASYDENTRQHVPQVAFTMAEIRWPPGSLKDYLSYAVEY